MQLSCAASVTQRMPREQARFSLATWRNHEISASRRIRVSEQSAQTCVEDRGFSVKGHRILLIMAAAKLRLVDM